MKSRLAILAMLVAGLVFSTAGAGLAVSSGNDASKAQYATPTPTATPEENAPSGGVSPSEEENTPPSNTAPNGGVSPAEENAAQPTRQESAAANTSQLPFTGFAAIPVLLGGLALLAGGLVLRRRTRSE